MGSDDRIAASLPQPPLPAPARRTAAIEAALRRFDGGQASSDAVPPSRAAPWWRHMDYRQAGALASIALVAVIALPLAWTSMGGEESVETAAPPPASRAGTDLQPSAEAFADAKAVLPPALSEGGDAAPRAQPPAAAAPSAAAPPPMVFAEAAPPPVAAARSEPLAKVAGGPARYQAEPAETAAFAARESRGRAAAPAGAMPPPPAVADAAAAGAAESSLVVTGAGAQAAKPAARGDWNACTVDDPLRSLQACGHLVDPAAEGSAGRAAAQLADGLALAWSGDFDKAIHAFDRAIERNPDSSFAYLNRGLAHRRNGSLDRAIADLDRAVRSDPRSARAFYNRSLLLRQKGDEQRARADADRAARLDPRYAPLTGGDRRP